MPSSVLAGSTSDRPKGPGITQLGCSFCQMSPSQQLWIQIKSWPKNALTHCKKARLAPALNTQSNSGFLGSRYVCKTPSQLLTAAGEYGEKWKNTKVFSNYQAMLEDTASKPTAAFIGLPPKYHGALEDPNANIEVSKSLQPSMSLGNNGLYLSLF